MVYFTPKEIEIKQNGGVGRGGIIILNETHWIYCRFMIITCVSSTSKNPESYQLDAGK